MITFLSDDNNDLTLNPGGNLEPYSGILAIAQTAKEYMQTRLGEMFLLADRGVPYQEIVFGASPNISQFEAAGRARLLEVPDVIEVTQFAARKVNDVLLYTATIRTNLGEITING